MLSIHQITTIINQINKIIDKYGIPYHKKSWKKLLIPSNFPSHHDLTKFLNEYVNKYHHHSFITDVQHEQQHERKYSKFISKSNQRYPRKLPKFYWDSTAKIGRIKYYHFYNSQSAKLNQHDKNKIINSTKYHFNKWVHLGLKGIIIDLSQHRGGDMRPGLESLYPILGDNTLFAFTNKQVSFNKKQWVNLENGQIKFNRHYSVKPLQYPIAVIINKKTTSSGEIISSAFKGRANCKFFGQDSNGSASVNDSIPLKNGYELMLTSVLIGTIDRTLIVNEKITTDHKTNKPIIAAKKWLISQNQKLI